MDSDGPSPEGKVGSASGMDSWMPISLRMFVWGRNGLIPVLPLCFTVLFLCLCLPCAGSLDSVGTALEHDKCAMYGDIGSSVNARGGSLVGFSVVENVCARAQSFCFPSTLVGFVAEEDSHKAPSSDVSAGFSQIGQRSSSWHPRTAAFDLLNGGVVSCSLLDSTSDVDNSLHLRNRVFGRGEVISCGESIVSDIWMQRSSELAVSLDDHSKEISFGIPKSSLSPHVDISPPALDWGEVNLYSPSLAFLTMTNKHSDSVLYVYEPFSANSQFYAYNFEEMSLAPGEAASIDFVFLPRWSGASSAHLAFQTSFGGFVIHATGVGIESPYRIEPLTSFHVSTNGLLHRNLSLYNPFDDVLHVEEVTAWVYSENEMHSGLFSCSRDPSQQSSGLSYFPNGKKWFAINSGELGRPGLEIRPSQWDVRPLGSETILEMKLWSHMQGKVLGALCLQLRNSMGDEPDAIIVPLEVDIPAKATYSALTSSVSIYFEPLGWSRGRESTVTLSLRNNGSCLLTLVSISEVTQGLQVFQIKSVEGLLLYPGSLTKIALLSYTHQIVSQDVVVEDHYLSPDCNLLIVTNDSFNPKIGIPCQDLIDSSYKHEAESEPRTFYGSHSGVGLQQGKEKSTEEKSGPSGVLIEEPAEIKSKIIEIMESDDLILSNWRSQGYASDMSVLKDRDLLFPVVQIGNHFSKWITVHNPSQRPVFMQLVLNSGAIIDQCKASDSLLKEMFPTIFPNVDSMGAPYGFSIGDLAITEAYVHPSESALFGPVVFHPTNRCMWRTSALIRSNLSGVEWLPLQAFGGSHSLVLLEGSEPVQNLIFSFDLGENLNFSTLYSSHHLETADLSCNHQLSKEIHAKNVGELPLEVMNLKVSGTECGLDGFLIHPCKGFSLAPGESARFQIYYQPDFSTVHVHRNLELSTATGFLEIPMKADLPVLLSNLCNKPSVWKALCKKFPWVVAAMLVTYLLLSSLPHASPSAAEDHSVKGEPTIATITRIEKPSHAKHNIRYARTFKQNMKHEAIFVNGCSHCQRGIQDSPQEICAQEMKGKQSSEQQKKTTELSSAAAIPAGLPGSSDVLEAPQSGNLTVKVTREKGKRKKRRSTAAGLAAKFEVSSSQSGNSTPSSPLSPSISSLKQVWPQSQDTNSYTFTEASEEQIFRRKQDGGVPLEATVLKPRSYSHSCSPPAQDRHSSPVKTTGKPVLLPSATYPGIGRHVPDVATPNFLALTSPIAPHARAPGSNLNKEKRIKQLEDDVKEFTYDIWGDHFSDKLLVRPTEITGKVFDASEGVTRSFFAREPQSLMTVSSAHSESPGHKLLQPVSPGHKLPANYVTCPDQMD